MGGGKPIFLILFLLFLPWTFAQTCNFNDIETYSEREPRLIYENRQKIGGELLEIRNFINQSQGSNPQSTFEVYNPNNFPIWAYFSYDMEGIGASPQPEYGKKILPHDSTLYRELCRDDALNQTGFCGIKPETLTYFVRKLDESEKMILGEGLITKYREHPDKPCPNGPSDCFTGKCNLMGFCDTRVLIPCCGEKPFNCKNISCVMTETKKPQESFLCVEECQFKLGRDGICKLPDRSSCSQDVECYSGICNFAKKCGTFVESDCLPEKNCGNFSCATPSSRKNGQSYSCEWECKSQNGYGGICGLSKTSLFFFIALFFFLTGLGFYLYRRAQNKKEGEQILVAAEREANLIKVRAKSEADVHIQAAKIKATSLEKEAEAKFNSIKQKAKDLERQAIDIRNKAKKRLKKLSDTQEIRKLREEAEKNARKKELEAEKLLIQALSSQYEADKHSQLVIAQARGEAERIKEDARQKAIEDTKKIIVEDRYWKELLNSKGEERLTRNGDGYPIWPNGEPFHVYYYWEQYLQKYGKECPSGEKIHHIDNIKTNWNFWNLIHLSSEEHKKIKHGRIPIPAPGKELDSWKIGIEVLLDCLGWTENDLPPHIREKLEEMRKS